MNFEPARLYATLIDRLSDVPGVIATAAFDESGQCLACYVGESFAELGVGRVIPILQELAAPTDPRSPFEEGVTFVEGHLVRVLVRRAATSTLIALLDPEADVDLVVAHLGRAIDQVARASRPPPPVSQAALDARPSSGFYPRPDDSGTAPSSDGPHVAKMIDDASLKRLEELALEALGFASEIVFERAKVSVTSLAGHVPRARWVELVGRLAGEIEDDDARELFITRALTLPSRPREAGGLDLLSPLARWVLEHKVG